MGSIKIVTDSTSDLSAEELQKHDIHMVPLNIHFRDKTFKDGIDLTPDSFYAMLTSDPEHPKTSQPSPADFKQKYEELLADGSVIVSIHISSKMSGTWQSATMAKNELNSDKIHIIDSGFVSIALGLMAVECARARDEGKSVQDILAMVETVKSHMRVYFIVDTLEFLQKGGRIGKASAIIGGLLNIKPILMIKDGEVCPYEKVRGAGKVFIKMGRIFAGYKKENEGREIKLGFAHAAAADHVEKLSREANKTYDVSSAFITEIGPVVGAHAGPGTLAMCFY